MGEEDEDRQMKDKISDDDTQTNQQKAHKHNVMKGFSERQAFWASPLSGG